MKNKPLLLLSPPFISSSTLSISLSCARALFLDQQAIIMQCN